MSFRRESKAFRLGKPEGVLVEQRRVLRAEGGFPTNRGKQYPWQKRHGEEVRVVELERCIGQSLWG